MTRGSTLLPASTNQQRIDGFQELTAKAVPRFPLGNDALNGCRLLSPTGRT
jgi:hypothetical protein